MVELSFDVVGDHRKVWLAEQLTVHPAKQSIRFEKLERDENGKEIQPPPPTPIKLFITDHDRRVVKVPFRWGMDFLADNPTLGYDLKLTRGIRWTPIRLPDPDHPNAAPGQREFFDNIESTVRKQGAVLLEAPTGSGKTVAMLHTIGKLGQTALVIVPSKALADQWTIEAKLHLGLEPDEIGLIQGPNMRWKECKLVVAVIHNLFQKEWSDEFYQYFGTVCWDEAHRLGAPEFSKTMPLFPAANRMGATATPDRKDGCMDVVTLHLGEVGVRLNSDALSCECRVIRYSDPFAHKYARLPLPTLLRIITKNKARNEMIVDAVVRMFHKGRNVLVLSDRVEHLQTLQTLTVGHGIPKDITGLYVGGYKVGKVKKTTGQGYLREIRENPQYRIIFATYSMMKEGTNIPRLDAGIDATPRADGIQAIGRIRRPFPGKKVPVWFTPIDIAVPLLNAFGKTRLRDYQKANVTVIDQ
jgi:superfamily II DNA or RNA helicase